MARVFLFMLVSSEMFLASAMCFLGEGLFVKANRHKEIPAPLKLLTNKTPAFNMEQLNVTELETMDVAMKKGFL